MNDQINIKDNKSLDQRQQSLVKISILTSIGDVDRLKTQLNEGLDYGLTINEIKETLVQLYAYCGFPRSLNGISTFKVVLDERKDKGIEDLEGEKIIVENNPPDKYEQGRKTLEKLTNTVQLKLAPGFGEFAPRIDAFLKEHLFADIFASDVLSFQNRELITISCLASMPGLEGQLSAHISMGKNTGLLENQISEVFNIVELIVDKAQAQRARMVLKN